MRETPASPLLPMPPWAPPVGPVSGILVASGTRFDGEADAFAPGLRQALEARGMRVRAGAGEDSGVHRDACLPAPIR